MTNKEDAVKAAFALAAKIKFAKLSKTGFERPMQELEASLTQFVGGSALFDPDTDAEYILQKSNNLLRVATSLFKTEDDIPEAYRKELLKLCHVMVNIDNIHRYEPK